MKVYHQQAANLNNFDENIEFIVEENNSYHQIGNAYLQYETRIEKDVANPVGRVLVDADVNGLGKCFCKLFQKGNFFNDRWWWYWAY